MLKTKSLQRYLLWIVEKLVLTSLLAKIWNYWCLQIQRQQWSRVPWSIPRQSLWKRSSHLTNRWQCTNVQRLERHKILERSCSFNVSVWNKNTRTKTQQRIDIKQWRSTLIEQEQKWSSWSGLVLVYNIYLSLPQQLCWFKAWWWDQIPIMMACFAHHDISMLLNFYFWQPVYYILDMEDSSFGVKSTENRARWVGIYEKIGANMCYKLINHKSGKIVYCSVIWSATEPGTVNLWIDPIEPLPPDTIPNTKPDAMLDEMITFADFETSWDGER